MNSKNILVVLVISVLSLAVILSLSVPQVSAAKTMTFTSNPSGSGFITVGGSLVTTPTTAEMNNNNQKVLTANTPVSGGAGIQYIFTGWTNTGGSLSSTTNTQTTFTAGTSAATVTANYQTQYQVAFSTNQVGAGTITTPTSTPQWYNAASSGNSISATANTGFHFVYWTTTGPITIESDTSTSTTATVNGPGTITANFAPDFVLPEYLFGGLAALVTCFIGFGFFIIIKKRNGLLHLQF
jgi:hypothetical protein